MAMVSVQDNHVAAGKPVTGIAQKSSEALA